MDTPIGFPSGCLAHCSPHATIAFSQAAGFPALELHPQNIHDPILALSRHRFTYWSCHLPDKPEVSDRDLTRMICQDSTHTDNFIIHANKIKLPSEWEPYQDKVLVENMDNNRTFGRYPEEMEEIFDSLPNAGFCFDLGHAFQVDPTLSLAKEMVAAFGDRLKELHISYVDQEGHHHSIPGELFEPFAEITQNIPQDIPTIIEPSMALPLSLIQQERFVKNLPRANPRLPRPTHDERATHAPALGRPLSCSANAPSAAP